MVCFVSFSFLNEDTKFNGNGTGVHQEGVGGKTGCSQNTVYKILKELIFKFIFKNIQMIIIIIIDPSSKEACKNKTKWSLPGMATHRYNPIDQEAGAGKFPKGKASLSYRMTLRSTK